MDPFIIGIIAGTLCTLSFLPQVVLIVRTKNAKNISLTTFLVFSLGVFLWLVYGVILKAAPIIFANAITLLLALTIVVMKIKYG